MKAVYLTKYGNSSKAFEIRETDIPSPGDHEVVIKVESFGLNFADVVARRGLYPDAPKNPAVLGYDVAGYIHQVGAKVTRFKEGDRVVALTRFGGYAEYALTIEDGVAHLDESIDFPSATALSTQACTAYYCAHEVTKLHAGDRILVHAAAGGVGSMLVQMAKAKSCYVIGTASSTKQEYLKSIGVDLAIDYTKDDFYKVIKRSEGGGVDIIYDSIGGKTFKKGMKILNPAGRMVTFGAASQINGNKTSKFKAIGVVLGFGIFTPISLLMKSQAIIGVNMLRVADERPHVFKECLEATVQMAKNGTITPKLAKVFKVDDIVHAHDYLELRKSIGKIAMEW